MREAQGLSLRDLAKLADTDHSYISKVERELVTPTGRWLISITDALADHIMNGGAA